MKTLRLYVFCLFIFFALSGCTGEKPATKEMTETKTTEGKAEEIKKETKGERREEKKTLPTEKELGIKHPINFHDDIKIYAADDFITMKRYEVPTKIDEHHMLITDTILAKGKLHATVILRMKGDTDGGVHYRTEAIGYYDLEKKELVRIRDIHEAPYPSSEELDSSRFYPMDEDHFIYEEIDFGVTKYSIYSISDGSFTEIERFENEEELHYQGPPYITKDHLYLLELTEDQTVRTHIYDRKTRKKIRIVEGVMNVYLSHFGLVYTNKTQFENPWSKELYIGDHVYRWDGEKGEFFIYCAIGSHPDQVYALLQYEGTDELDGDITEENGNGEKVYVPSSKLYAFPDDREIFSNVGDLPSIQVTDRWISLWRICEHEGKDIPLAYLYIPEERIALRIEAPEESAYLMLLPYERYALFDGYGDDETGVKVVYTIVPHDGK